MKIEPCTCHFKYPEQYTVDANCWYFYCPRCGARGGFGTTVEQALHEWNRPARIVRAAETWAKARRTGTMLEISEAGNALLEAVEGGRADG